MKKHSLYNVQTNYQRYLKNKTHFYKKKKKKKKKAIRRSKNHVDNLQDSNLQTGIRVTSQVEVLRSSKKS